MTTKPSTRALTLSDRQRLDTFIAQQATELEAFEQREAELTPQQEANIAARDEAAQADFDTGVSGSLLAESTAAQQPELRAAALAQINQPTAVPQAVAPPSLGDISSIAQEESSRVGLDFASLRSKIEGDQLARRGLFGDQRQFIEDILAEQQNLTEGQKALISQAANQSIALGRGDIQTNLRDTLEILREELAPARGLRPTDSPIIDRGSRLGRESLRLGERLTSQVRGDETAALLALPKSQREFQFQANEQLAQLIAQESGMDIESARQLAALQAQEEQFRQGQLDLTGSQAINLAGLTEEQRQFTSGLDLSRNRLRTEQIQAQQGFGRALTQFQNQLKTEAFNRQLAETGLVGNLGLNLSNISPSGVGFDVGTESTARGTGTGAEILTSFAGGAGQGAGALL